MLRVSIRKSDVLLKRNVVYLGLSRTGVPVYSFTYINDLSNQLQIGTMAQDLLQLGRQDDVFVDLVTNMMMVDYGLIDIVI